MVPWAGTEYTWSWWSEKDTAQGIPSYWLVPKQIQGAAALHATSAGVRRDWPWVTVLAHDDNTALPGGSGSHNRCPAQCDAGAAPRTGLKTVFPLPSELGLSPKSLFYLGLQCIFHMGKILPLMKDPRRKPTCAG